MKNTKIYLFSLIPLLFIYFIPGSLFAEKAILQKIEEGESLFNQGEYDKADNLAKELAKDFDSFPIQEKKRFLHLCSRLDFDFNRNSTLKEDLKDLYDIDPNYKLDPFQDPPLSHQIWNDLKKKAETKKKELSPESKISFSDKFKEKDDYIRNKSRFWIAALPLGIGHFDAGQPWQGFAFLSGEILTIFAASDISRKESEDMDPGKIRSSSSEAAGLGSKQSHTSKSNYYGGMLGTFGFLGIWGYELCDIMPELYQRDADKAAWTRYLVSFLPFGAGQRKNDENIKAVAFAVVEASLMAVGTNSGNQYVRDRAMFLWAVSAAYGAYDGWANHKWIQPSAKQTSWSTNVEPLVLLGRSGKSIDLGLLSTASFHF